MKEDIKPKKAVSRAGSKSHIDWVVVIYICSLFEKKKNPKISVYF